MESEGLIINNQKEKIWKYYYPNLKIEKQIFYKENKPFGKAEYFFKNGNIKMVGSFDEEGLKGDLWKTYSENGNLLSKGMFDRGKKIKGWSYYSLNGSLKKQEFLNTFGDIMNKKNYDIVGNLIRNVDYFENNQLQKESYKVDSLSNKFMIREYYELGQIKSEGIKLNKIEIGQWTFWYPNGHKKAEGNFLENHHSINYKNIDLKINPNDLPLNQKFNGIKIGNWIFWNKQGKKITDVDYVLKEDRILEKVNYFNL